MAVTVSDVPTGVTDDFWAFLLSVDNPVVMDPAKMGKVALAFTVSILACELSVRYCLMPAFARLTTWTLTWL